MDWPANPEDGKLADELGAVLTRLYSFLRRTILPAEMSLSQALALGTLRDLGPQRITDLAELEGVRQPTCTGLVNALEEQGWVVRRLDDADRRAVMVELTPKGREVLQSMTEARSALFVTYLSALPAAERDALAGALSGLKGLIDLGAEVTPPSG